MNEYYVDIFGRLMYGQTYIEGVVEYMDGNDQELTLCAF